MSTEILFAPAVASSNNNLLLNLNISALTGISSSKIDTLKDRLEYDKSSAMLYSLKSREIDDSSSELTDCFRDFQISRGACFANIKVQRAIWHAGSGFDGITREDRLGSYIKGDDIIKKELREEIEMTFETYQENKEELFIEDGEEVWGWIQALDYVLYQMNLAEKESDEQ